MCPAASGSTIAHLWYSWDNVSSIFMRMYACVWTLRSSCGPPRTSLKCHLWRLSLMVDIFFLLNIVQMISIVLTLLSTTVMRRCLICKLNLTWIVDDSRFSDSWAESSAVTTRLYVLIVSRSSRRLVRIVPFCAISKSLLSSPAVMLYSMWPLCPVMIK